MMPMSERTGCVTLPVPRPPLFISIPASNSPDAFKLALGRRYNRTKKAAHRPKEVDQIDPVNYQSTAAKLAAEHSVSEATINWRIKQRSN